jgi:hypothetical protein
MFPRIHGRLRIALLMASVVGLAGLLAPGGANAAPALGAVVSTNPVNWTPHVSNGAVYKFVEAANGLMYAGGSFSEVTAASGIQPGIVFKRNNLVAFNPRTGLVHGFRPSFNGAVWALATDGTSLYVGGDFTTVDGQPRSRLAKFGLATGALDANFRPGLQAGVRDAVFVNGRLIVSGIFNKKIASINLSNGSTTSYLNIPITGTVADNAGPTEVYRIAVNPSGTRLVGVGNFTSVGGSTRYRALMLNLGSTSATVSPWQYVPLRNMCAASSLPDYLRDVDFSPDGSWFAIASTGFVPQSGGIGRDICDATARFETATLAPSRPTWINYTGGDTLHSVAATDVAVYVQGHQRWLDNPLGRDSAGPGAVSRPGIGAMHPTTGLALSWNPTKDRGVGGKDLYVTSQGLWVGSDTTHIGGEYHARIALMPR